MLSCRSIQFQSLAWYQTCRTGFHFLSLVSPARLQLRYHRFIISLTLDHCQMFACLKLRNRMLQKHSPKKMCPRGSPCAAESIKPPISLPHLSLNKMIFGGKKQSNWAEIALPPFFFPMSLLDIQCNSWSVLRWERASEKSLCPLSCGRAGLSLNHPNYQHSLWISPWWALHFTRVEMHRKTIILR